MVVSILVGVTLLVDADQGGVGWVARVSMRRHVWAGEPIDRPREEAGQAHKSLARRSDEGEPLADMEELPGGGATGGVVRPDSRGYDVNQLLGHPQGGAWGRTLDRL